MSDLSTAENEDAEFRYHAALVKAAPRLLAEVLRRRR